MKLSAPKTSDGGSSPVVKPKEEKQVVMEDQEPAEFWVALGGKAPYARDKRYGELAA